MALSVCFNLKLLNTAPKNEYGVDLLNHTLPYSVARWIDGEVDIPTLKGLDNAMIVKDNRDRTVVLYRQRMANGLGSRA